MKNRISTLFLDVDGTLLCHNGRLSKQNEAAILKGKKNGLNIFFATGRHKLSLLDVFKDTNLYGKNGIIHPDSPGIFIQGLSVHGQNGKNLHEKYLDEKTIEQVFKYGRQNNYSVCGFSDDNIYATDIDEGLKQLHVVHKEPMAIKLKTTKEVFQKNIKKLLFLNNNPSELAEIKTYWTNYYLNDKDIQVVQSVPNMIEIFPTEGGKGYAINVLCKHLNINIEETAGMGDGDNDVTMMETVAFPIAPNNAKEVIKGMVKVIMPSNNDHGVAHAIEHIISHNNRLTKKKIFASR